MTDEPGVAATESPQSPPDDSRFASFAELRTAHLDLRKSFSDTDRADDAKSASQLREFLAKARNSGAILADPSVRKAAQGILDYWSAELAGMSDAKTGDFVPFALAPPDMSAMAAAEQTDSSASQPPQRKEDQRVLIRLAGNARQWRSSGKLPDYLLTGGVLEQARRFADQDPDLTELVEASEEAERGRRRRKRNAAYAGLSGFLMLASIASLFIWQFVALPKTSQSLIRQIKESTSGEVQQRKLWWLAFLQPWLQPYDFSGTRIISNVALPGFKMSAPNFSRVGFSNVRFPNAKLPSASFSGSSFLVDGKYKESANKNDFSGADLASSQYSGASIFSTSFADADLYRATFDRAMLCDVDFSHADLRSASFWAATPDDKTYASLRKTIWWVAGGWNSSHLEKLLISQDPAEPQNSSSAQPSTGVDDIRATRQAMRRSDRFCKELQQPIAEAAPGTFDRAMALNDLAWTLATWGIDRDSPPAEENYCPVQGMPKNALDAADQAIAIIEDLKRKGSVDKDYAYWLANFHDTKAYILMQGGQMADAKAIYEMDLERTKADPGALFRYAIALFAANRATEADQAFKDAIGKRYLPRDELENLKRYIPPAVRQMAYTVIDNAFPAPKDGPTCEALAASPN